MRTLRPYQAEGVDKIYAEWDRGILRTAIVYATGLGKTDLIAKVATDQVVKARLEGRKACVIVLAHRKELLRQIEQRLKMHLHDVTVGWCQAQRNEVNREVIVASVATLKNVARQRQIRRPQLVIVDECHHAPSASYQTVLRWAGCLDDDERGTTASVRCLGVTATMVRADKLGLGDTWQSTADVRDIQWAIRHGWLVVPRGRCVVAKHMQLNKVKIRAGDYTDRELGEMIQQDVGQIADGWEAEAIDERHPQGRITAAFCPSIASAKALTDEFNARGVKAELVIGSTPDAEREQIYARLAAGVTRVKVDVMVGTEGFDCPAISCILLARPTKLIGLFTQMVGRGLRLDDTHAQHGRPPKLDCLVLDVVGASRHQKLITVVDLLPTAERDTSELDAYLCPDCDGELVDGECAHCDDEGADDRAIDGADEKPKLLGRTEIAGYDDVAFYQEFTLRWLQTRKKIWFTSAGDRYAYIWEEQGPDGKPDGTYSAGWVNVKGDHTYGEWLQGAERVPRRRAIAFAEEFVARHRGQLRGDLRREHSGRAGAKLREWAAAIGLPAPERHNAAALSDAVNIDVASKRLDRWVV
jgi:superfamily II DNA or RNA helicase